MFLALVLPVTPVFADITWNPVMEGYDMTEDEYFAEAAEGESGTFSFTGGNLLIRRMLIFMLQVFILQAYHSHQPLVLT